MKRLRDGNILLSGLVGYCAYLFDEYSLKLGILYCICVMGKGVIKKY